MSRSALPSPFTDFPLALWSAAFVFDVASVHVGAAMSFAAFSNLALGCVIAVVALAMGGLEYNRLAGDRATRRHAVAHAALCAGALLCFALSLHVRVVAPEAFVTPPEAFLLGAAGLLLSLGAAWIGGHLAFEQATNEWAHVERERRRRTHPAKSRTVP